MKKNKREFYANSADVPDDPNRYVISKEDLEGKELQIYDRISIKLKDPTPDKLRMLATYSWLAFEFKESAENKKLAIFIHRCMVYARNRLGIWKPEPIDRMELFLYDGYGFNETFFPLYLDDAWEIAAN